jgi:hypothetical protein
MAPHHAEATCGYEWRSKHLEVVVNPLPEKHVVNNTRPYIHRKSFLIYTWAQGPITKSLGPEKRRHFWAPITDYYV